MSASRVVLSWEAARNCISHALTTEHQEIMGLLLGQISPSEVYITRSLILSRKDRKRDRVEVGYQDLALASTIAEKFTSLDNLSQTVVGWYHSHPHITAMPSHVDVRTQGHYQQLDIGFIGLIFSVFDKGKLEICAFQSLGNTPGSDCQWTAIEIPIFILPDQPPNMQAPIPTTSTIPISIHLENNIALLSILLNEDKQIFQSVTSPNSGASSSSSVSDQDNMLNWPLDSSPSEVLLGQDLGGRTRYFNIYQSSLLHLIDLQLRPSLFALQSRAKTLRLRRDLLRSKLTQQGVDIPAANVTAPELSERLSVVDSLTPLWSDSSLCLQLIFNGITITIAQVPSSWDGISTFLPHQLRIIPTPLDHRCHHECCFSTWSIQLDQDPKYTLPVLTMQTTHQDLSYDCQWLVGDTNSIIGFNIVGHREAGDINDEMRQRWVGLFRNSLSKSLYVSS